MVLLPPAVPGTLAYISDGLGANCGDAAGSHWRPHADAADGADRDRKSKPPASSTSLCWRSRKSKELPGNEFTTRTSHAPPVSSTLRGLWLQFTSRQADAITKRLSDMTDAELATLEARMIAAAPIVLEATAEVSDDAGELADDDVEDSPPDATA